jgi:hypothetical protein
LASFKLKKIFLKTGCSVKRNKKDFFKKESKSQQGFFLYRKHENKNPPKAQIASERRLMNISFRKSIDETNIRNP